MHSIEELKKQLEGSKHGEVNYRAKNIDKGTQITIASENPEIVNKLQEWASRTEAQHKNHKNHAH